MLYKAQQFNLSGLHGISDQTLELHLKLYDGYVQATNNLQEKIADLCRKDQFPEHLPTYWALKQRQAFEYNGMFLHEYYFANLTRQSSISPDNDSRFFRLAGKSFGTYALWKGDFIRVGSLRGVGWAICYADPRSGQISNHWISLHENGHVAGLQPILVMDVWEHAYLLDYKPAERNKYINAFFSHVDWNVVDARIQGKSSRDYDSAANQPSADSHVTTPA